MSPIDLDQVRYMAQCQRGMPWGRGHDDCPDWCPPRARRFDTRFCKKPDVCRLEGGCHMVLTAERLEEESRHATATPRPGPTADEPSRRQSPIARVDESKRFQQAENTDREPKLGRRR